MAANANMIVKITDGKDIRRFTVSTTNLTYNSIHKHAADSFVKEKKFKLMYKDDEGDQITMSTDAEIQEAVGLTLKLEPPVLRLTLVPIAKSRDPSPEKERETPNEPPELAQLFKNIKQQLPTLLENLPASIKANLENLDLAASIAATADAAAACSGANPATNPDMEGYHPGVICDKSHQNPISGARYHLKGHNWDLCAAEYNKLSDAEKAQFEAIEPTVFRYRAKAAEDKPAAPKGFHPGVTCDKTGQCPIFGWRYHLTGHNFDLCEAEFNKLPDAEKGIYEKISPPQQCWGGRGGWGRGCGGKFGGGWKTHAGWHGGGGGWGGAGAWAHAGRGGAWAGPTWGGAGAWAHSESDAESEAPGKGKGKGKGCGGGNREDGGVPNHKMLAARFVCDVAIFDGTQMAPGTKFTKIWRLKNTGEVPWPPGTQIIFVGGDQMQSALTVPLSRRGPVMPDEEVDVSVDLVAPQEHGRYVGYWRLTGPMGRKKWGQRFWTHVHVVDPQAEPQPPTEKEMAEIQAATSDRELDEDAEDPPEGEGAADEQMLETGSEDGEILPDAATVTAMMQAATVHDAVGAMVNTMMDAAHGGATPNTNTDTNTNQGAGTSDEPMPPGPAEPEPQGPPPASLPASPPHTEAPAATDVAKTIGEMGFVNEPELVQYVIEKNGPDADACARDLSNLNSWGEGLTDLLEMGFENTMLNAKLMIKNGGSVKNTVRDLVADN